MPVFCTVTFKKIYLINQYSIDVFYLELDLQVQPGQNVSKISENKFFTFLFTQFNPFQPSGAVQVETSHLICRANVINQYSIDYFIDYQYSNQPMFD